MPKNKQETGKVTNAETSPTSSDVNFRRQERFDFPLYLHVDVLPAEQKLCDETQQQYQQQDQRGDSASGKNSPPAFSPLAGRHNASANTSKQVNKQANKHTARKIDGSLTTSRVIIYQTIDKQWETEKPSCSVGTP